MAHSAVQGNDKEKLAYVWYSFHLLEFGLDEHKLLEMSASMSLCC